MKLLLPILLALGLGLANGKAAVVAIVDAIPTVESLTHGHRRAM